MWFAQEDPAITEDPAIFEFQEIERKEIQTDTDGDGLPDMDAHSRCYRLGDGVTSLLASPIYYLGMLVYYLLSPVIWVAELLRTSIGTLFWLLTIPFRVMWMMAEFVLYAVYWVLSLFPWVLWKLIVVATSTVGQLVFPIMCAVLFAGAIVALNNAGRKNLVAALVVLGAVLVGSVFLNGLDLMLRFTMSIVFCPFQLIAGIVGAIASSL